MRRFGRTLLLLFWAVIGWKVLGNYTLEIERPNRTIPLAVTLSFLAIAAIYLAVTRAWPRRWRNADACLARFRSATATAFPYAP